VADDDPAHFFVEAAERIDMDAFHVSRTDSEKAQNGLAQAYMGD